MDKLSKAREIINETDREIAALFQKRMEAVRLVGEYKKENNLPVDDFVREEELLLNNLQHIKDEEIRNLYVPFFKKTVSLSKDLQRNVLENGENMLVNLNENSYDIVIKRGAVKNIGEYLSFAEGRKVLVITDSGVPGEYAEAVAAAFQNSTIFSFENGEKSKSSETVNRIYENLLSLSFTRKDCIIAVGGGVVGDVAGFAAATYMRGIDFYNVPTTLLSQVDSSVGGKTGVNFGSFKNIIGAFYQPKKVIIDPDVLSTLSERQLKNGLAESIKTGLTLDKELFEIFRHKDYLSHIDEIISRSVRAKKLVIEKDEKESGIRKVLNFGHTIGHAIESADKNLFHGECVALGILPMCSENIYKEVNEVLLNVGLPAYYTGDKKALENAVLHDKKSEGEHITVVKCEEIGTYYFEKLTTDEIIDLI